MSKPFTDYLSLYRPSLLVEHHAELVELFCARCELSCGMMDLTTATADELKSSSGKMSIPV